MTNQRVQGIDRCAYTALAVGLVTLVLFVQPAFCQTLGFPSGSLVSGEMTHSLSVFHQGSFGHLAISVDVAEGWHVNANKPLESYLIPTVLTVDAPAGIEVVRILYPEPALRKLDISPTKMALYDGHVTFGALIRVSDGLAPGSYRISATLRYQGCNNLTCIEPASTTIADTVRVGTIGEAVEMLSPRIFSQPPFVNDAGELIGMEMAGSERDLGHLIGERGIFLAFILVFIGGLGLNLTPCIYPLIPITVSYFGGQAAGKASRVLLLALLYVLGMSITYSVLGTAAAMTGSLFGSALQNPWVILFIAAVLIALAASMFGFWEIRMPTFLTRRTGTARQGFIGAIVMGLTVGIIAAPCIGPFVLGLLTYVGNTGKPLLGFLLFFTLAWGMGIPFIVLGTLSGSISRLPRSGDWMVWVRKIFGFILIAMALYFARNLASPRLVSAGYALIAGIAGVYLGWVDRSVKAAGGFRALRNVIGVAGVALAAIVIILPTARGGSVDGGGGIPWEPFSEERVAEAGRQGRPVVIDFSAAWCIMCHELDSKTFPDPTVRDLFKNVVPLKADLTKSGEAEQGIRNRFGIRGLPVIIFIDRTGSEMKTLRATGFINAGELAKRLGELLGTKADS